MGLHAARTTFMAEKKALLSMMSPTTMMSQSLLVSETKFQHTVTTTSFFARFSVKALFLRPFCKNLIKLRILGFFFLWCEG